MNTLKEILPEQTGKVLYVNYENYQEVKKKIQQTQVVIITHIRLKEIAIEQKTVDSFTIWQNEKRKIIIDEMPDMIDYFIHKSSDACEWVNDWLDVNGTIYTNQDRLKLRHFIMNLLKDKITFEESPKTGKPLLFNISNEEAKQTLIGFLNRTNNRLHEIKSFESRNIFRWFKRLCLEENVGYIDQEVACKKKRNEQKIICSQKIDYSKFGCPLIIMDGTAIATPTLYQGYTIIQLKNHTCDNRLTIIHHNINTSASARTKLITFKKISDEMNRLRNQQRNPYLIGYKKDYDKYKQLKIIEGNNPFYEKINLFSTAGKNYLAEYTDLYLGALPIHPPETYKAIAIGLFENDTKLLDLRIRSTTQWFEDERIETIYRELVLKELIQIIFRSNIRKLLEPKTKKVTVTIATNKKKMLFFLQNLFFQMGMGNVSFIYDAPLTKKINSISETASKHAEELVNLIHQKKLPLPQPIRKIEDRNRSKIKSFVNCYWDNHAPIIQSAFAKYGIKITLNHKNWKYIDWL